MLSPPRRGKKDESRGSRLDFGRAFSDMSFEKVNKLATSPLSQDTSSLRPNCPCPNVFVAG